MAVGIIAEYNPFHNGHRYQIEEIRKKGKNADIVAVMSGNFTQRGEPAILDKFTRAELAVKGGCDLVLELPFIHAVRSAQDFANGGVNLLKNLGIIDKLAFGAEINDIESLKKVAEIFETTEFKVILQKKIDTGISYSKAICKASSEITGIDEKILKMPNVILAIEYLRALKSTNIKPLLIARKLADHNDNELHEKISSATAIRKEIYLNEPLWEKISVNVDENTFKALKNADLPHIEKLFNLIIIKIITGTAEELKNIYGMTEGLENKIIKAAYSAKNFNEFVNQIVSRRYTRSRIQRLLLYLLVGLKKNQIEQINNVQYARILAFNQRGRELIREIKKNAEIPIITKIIQHRDILKYDIISTDIAEILKTNFKLGKDFYTSPIYVN